MNANLFTLDRPSLWRRVLRRHISTISAPLAIRVVCLSIVLFAFLLVVRMQLVGLSWLATQSKATLVPKMLALGYYDFIYVAGLTTIFLALLALTPNRRRLRQLLFWSFCGLALLSLLIAAVNAQIVAAIGRPFTYQWFYYSDFLRSREAQSALFFNLPFSRLIRLGVVMAAVWLAARSLAIEVQTVCPPRFRRIAWGTLTAIVVLYVPLAGWYLHRQEWEIGKIANPVFAFTQSYFISAKDQPELFTMSVPEPFHGLKSGAEANAPEQQFPGNHDGQVKNVILFVMESVAGEYIDTLGSRYAATPEISHYASSSATFSRIYAHVPASNKSLVSLLGGIYPWVSYFTLTEERPDVTLPTLSSEFKKANLRTAFISASSLDFQRGNEFLAHRQFDIMEDQSTLNCGDRHYRSDQWSFLNGVDELCAVERLTSWIDEKPQAPFFAMMWTAGTHYPYFTLDEEIDYGVGDPFFNRYLNALHHTDKAIGQLIAELTKRGLDQSTLIVLVGDHGEAFGRHQQLTHASKIYEENIHVPLILINPLLFHGEHYDTIGGLADIAPTIFSILHRPAPALWQGYSLFRNDRMARTYFFTPWSDFLFGYREGDLKFIYNATIGTTEIYDLRQDPLETTNLAAQMSEHVVPGHEALAAWVQSQNRFFTQLLSEPTAQ